MEPTELQHYKRRLLERQRELLFNESDESPVPSAGGSNGDIVDQATADYEAELQIRLRQSERLLSRSIDDALARVAKHTYGICERCRQPISKARLEAVPWARLCLDCQQSERNV